MNSCTIMASPRKTGSRNSGAEQNNLRHCDEPQTCDTRVLCTDATSRNHSVMKHRHTKVPHSNRQPNNRHTCRQARDARGETKISRIMLHYTGIECHFAQVAPQCSATIVSDDNGTSWCFRRARGDALTSALMSPSRPRIDQQMCHPR